MNLVLADTEEFRRLKRKSTKPAAGSGSATATIETEEKRTLGLTIVRGANIVSLSVESPPPADPSTRLGKPTTGGLSTTLAAGPGVARPAGRGAPALQVSLAESRASAILDFRNANTRLGPGCGRRWCGASSRVSRIPSSTRLWRPWR